MAWYDAVLSESIAIMLLTPLMAREAGSAQAAMARDVSRRRGVRMSRYIVTVRFVIHTSFARSVKEWFDPAAISSNAR